VHEDVAADRAADRTHGDGLLHPREQLHVVEPRPTGQHDGDAVGRLHEAREGLLVAGPIRLDDVGAELGAQAHVAPEVLEPVLLPELLDRGVRGRELGLGDEGHAERGALTSHIGEKRHHVGLVLPAERGEQHHGVRSEDHRLLHVGDVHDVWTSARRIGRRRQQQGEGRRGRERRLGDPDHPLAHHDHVRAAGHRLYSSGSDVGQRLEEVR
jgi:hypothetical protein